MSPRQNALYWREWSAAKATLFPDSAIRIPQSAINERRHALHVGALGRDKSHVDFSNAEFDRVLGALRAISKPNDLDAQLRQARGKHRRLKWRLEQLMRELGLGENYVQQIVDTMNAEGRLSSPQLSTLNPQLPSDPWQRERERAQPVAQRKLETLTADELQKVVIALQQHKRRGGGVVYELHS